ncbi:MAG: DUF1223 domain-containing protein [Rhodoferax sp.]|uniref:DUF1223 domain-containing protein n=1 Tax=Rhodoferax sp. TaxID=50421 RepID=UPI002ACD82FD|nr:DUF1223 domain-containing protein [Rhodoferax sp.]MDZ7890738.1 DUF1223 domain-containing protein [Rhodoferax sp.]
MLRTSALLPVALALTPLLAQAANAVCEAQTGDKLTPVIELYTSEGCSSCPPADQWLSGLKGKPVVAQAFHVAYWDYIGWKDVYASPAFTTRQRDIAAANRLSNIYTPQVVRNGQDWRTWRLPLQTLDSKAPAKAHIALRKAEGSDQFEARVTPARGTGPWTAYWTVTEHNHSSRVKAGENAGEFLKHDFVVRQYVTLGHYDGAQVLKIGAIAAKPEHPRQINVVVTDAKSGESLQAISLQCAS